MIHNKAGMVVSAFNADINPFYLFLTNQECNQLPLPLAIQQKIPEALAWRGEWESCMANSVKASTLYHPRLRNWVGGAEDGQQVVYECQQYWSAK